MASEFVPALFTVASPGRSGTMWYSRLFTTSTTRCHHELTAMLRRYPTPIVLVDRLERETDDHAYELVQRRLVLELVPGYFDRLWEGSGGAAAVGNSDHLATPLLSGLWLLWPEMRFLFSYRDGINQVGSMAAWERQAERALLASWRARYGRGDYFECCCRDWAATVERLELHREWLRRRGATVVETRFERVTGDSQELERVWRALLGGLEPGPDRALMETVVNARTDSAGVRPPEAVWQSWSREHRRTFARICGDTQARLGYALPDVA